MDEPITEPQIEGFISNHNILLSQKLTKGDKALLH
jgi:hypothetical protein